MLIPTYTKTVFLTPNPLLCYTLLPVNVCDTISNEVMIIIIYKRVNRTDL